MINYNKSIPKFTTIKELLYHSATVFANNIAFTEKVKQNNETVYIDHTYTNLLDDINAFGTSLYELGLLYKYIIPSAFVDNINTYLSTILCCSSNSCFAFTSSLLRSITALFLYKTARIMNKKKTVICQIKV